MANDAFAALAHPTRREIVERLSGGAATVGEASRDLGVSKPTISRHRKMLEGLVRKLNTEEGYPDYIEDSARVIEGLQTVVSGALAEEIVEDLAELSEEEDPDRG